MARGADSPLGVIEPCKVKRNRVAFSYKAPAYHAPSSSKTLLPHNHSPQMDRDTAGPLPQNSIENHGFGNAGAVFIAIESRGV